MLANISLIDKTEELQASYPAGKTSTKTQHMLVFLVNMLCSANTFNSFLPLLPVFMLS